MAGKEPDSSDHREERAESRDTAADARDLAAMARDKSADARDAQARVRDLSARAAERAETREVADEDQGEDQGEDQPASEQEPEGSQPGSGLGDDETARQDLAAAAEDRQAAAGDRRSAESDRLAAARDRYSASAARQQSAVERAQAGPAEPTSTQERAMPEHKPSASPRPPARTDAPTPVPAVRSPAEPATADGDAEVDVEPATNPASRLSTGPELAETTFDTMRALNQGLELARQAVDLAAAVAHTEETISSTLHALGARDDSDIARRRRELADEAARGAVQATTRGARLQELAQHTTDHLQVMALWRLMRSATYGLTRLAETERSIAAALTELARRPDVVDQELQRESVRATIAARQARARADEIDHLGQLLEGRDRASAPQGAEPGREHPPEPDPAAAQDSPPPPS